MDGEKHSQLHNLGEKTLPQLMELLERQEHLISKPRLLNSLPDKGQKVKNFAQTLRQVISERQGKTKTAHSTSVAGPSSDQQVRPDQADVIDTASGEDDSQPQKQGSHYFGYGEVTNTDSDTTASLSECLEQLTVAELASPRMSSVKKVATDNGNLETRYTNSYENVMKRHEGETKRKPFKPHSSLKISNLQELPEDYKQKSKISKETEQTSSQKPKEVKAPWERAMPDPVYKLGAAKEISVQDSVQLQQKQREELEKLKSIHAAEKLSERLNIKTVNYQPETVDMEYRNSDMAGDDNAYDSDDVSDEEVDVLD